MDDTAAKRIDDEIAEVCGTLNATAGRLVALIAQALESGAYAVAGIHSAEQWVAWTCGVSPGRARRLVAMARRLGELPETRAALEAGELGEDQVAVICHHTPSAYDAEAAIVAREATVGQLQRILSRYRFDEPESAQPPSAEGRPEPEEPEPEAAEPAEPEPRRVSFGFTDEGQWRLSALLPPDEAALVERALAAARQAIFGGDADSADTPAKVSWADALVALADTYLGGEGVARPHHDRHLVLFHLGTDAEGALTGRLHLGPALPDALRRHLGCDARGRLVVGSDGVALSVGRTQRIVADRTRTAIEDRDGGCRVPGCDRSKWLQVHHIVHWEDGGATDTPNLVALCSAHHRAHHRGILGIEGNADDPGGLVFTDARGSPIAPCGRPRPPTEVKATGHWVHPSGDTFDPAWVYFNPTPPKAEEPPPPPTPGPNTVTFEDEDGELITVG